MGYMHINNLYKDQRILAFRRCFAMEKVHGTSANVAWREGRLHLSPGGEDAARFSAVFDHDDLAARFQALGHDPVVVCGEAYGGKQQGMRATYGDDLCFIAFEVRIGETWLAVPQAEKVVAALGLEFMPYEEGPTDLDWLNGERDRDSIVAIRRGMGPGKKREGIVIRPPFEVVTNNGERVMAKHKRDDFREMRTPRSVRADQLQVLTDAQGIADEWVTPMRLQHVLDACGIAEPYDMAVTGSVVRGMVEDVKREAAGEVVWTKEAERAVGAAAAKAYKRLVGAGVLA